MDNKESEHPYPEHQKLKAISDQSQAQGEFLDWCSKNAGSFMSRILAYPSKPRARAISRAVCIPKKLTLPKLALCARKRVASDTYLGKYDIKAILAPSPRLAPGPPMINHRGRQLRLRFRKLLPGDAIIDDLVDRLNIDNK